MLGDDDHIVTAVCVCVFVCVVRTFKTCSLSNAQAYNTVLLPSRHVVYCVCKTSSFRPFFYKGKTMLNAFSSGAFESSLPK